MYEKMKRRFYPEKHRILFATLLLVAFIPNFTEKSGVNLSVLSPYHSAVTKFEENIFQYINVMLWYEEMFC